MLSTLMTSLSFGSDTRRTPSLVHEGTYCHKPVNFTKSKYTTLPSGLINQRPLKRLTLYTTKGINEEFLDFYYLRNSFQSIRRCRTTLCPCVLFHEPCSSTTTGNITPQYRYVNVHYKRRNPQRLTRTQKVQSRFVVVGRETR